MNVWRFGLSGGAGESTGPDYRVYRNDVLLGTLTKVEPDMPWWTGTFDAAPGFEAVRPAFARLAELLSEDLTDEGFEAWQALSEGMRLEPLDGRAPITEFLLHIEADGRQASWRY